MPLKQFKIKRNGEQLHLSWANSGLRTKFIAMDFPVEGIKRQIKSGGQIRMNLSSV
jgi:hypothetical protein